MTYNSKIKKLKKSNVLNKNFSSFLLGMKKTRKSLRLSQKEIAKIIGVSTTTIYRMEMGKIPNFRIYKLIYDFYNTPSMRKTKYNIETEKSRFLASKYAFSISVFMSKVRKNDAGFSYLFYSIENAANNFLIYLEENFIEIKTKFEKLNSEKINPKINTETKIEKLNLIFKLLEATDKKMFLSILGNDPEKPLDRLMCSKIFKFLRKQTNLTQLNLSKIINISQSDICRTENEKNKLSEIRIIENLRSLYWKIKKTNDCFLYKMLFSFEIKTLNIREDQVIKFFNILHTNNKVWKILKKSPLFVADLFIRFSEAKFDSKI